ncbi:MAG TPA: NAD-dependent epimerase/dehydratase family protein [Hyphomicrobiaceae bacterium]|nr:NAD-dependent epimerase/dehydratase family protein [Hyphomicrobiaceae bacterium]
MSSKQLPRLAIIGCGAVVDHHLVPALKRVGWMPSVLIDTSPARIAVVARKMGSKGKSVVKGSDWRTMLDQFDAAIVAVPHSLHGAIGAGLTTAGKHVFMEKPLATTVGDCERIIEAANANGVTLSVGLLRRYLRIARWTKALIDSGTLGDIRHFDAREGFVFNWDTSTAAILNPTLSGGGVLMDTGAHTLDLVSWWFGRAAEIAYRDDAEGGVEADCVLDCTMTSGATGRIELSRTRELRNTIRIDGSKGFVEVHLYKNEVLAGSPNALAFVRDGISGSNMEPQFFPELFDSELRDFKNSVFGVANAGVTGTAGVASVDMIERAYKSRKPLTSAWADVPTPARPQGALAPSLPPNSKVLITGATGFIGGRLAETLVAQGASVRCLIRNFGHATRVARMPVEVVAADLANAEEIDKAVAGMDYVIHCAYDPRSRAQNITGNENLIAACARHKVRRLVYVSTFSVYEPFPDGPLDEETRDGDRGWIYVRSKLEMEAQVLKAAKEHGLPATIVQPTIVYGPFSKPWTNAPAENLIYGSVVLPDRGEGLCNAVYIDDLVDGLILAAVHPAAIGERFIMSGPKPVTWAEFFGTFADILGTAPPQYWPAERIAKSNHGLMRDIKLVAQNPKRIIQIIVRWYPARQMLQAGLDAMPEPLKGLVMKHYFGSGGRQPGDLILPDPQALNLFTAKPACSNEKARRLLGYRPRFDFASGMGPTGRYLEWAYGDLRRAVSRQTGLRQDETAAGSPDLANVG